MSEPPAHEKQWREDQKTHWKRQIRLSEWLNRITAAGTIIALAALIFLYIQINIAKTALKTSERAWVTIPGVTLEAPIVADQKARVVAGLRNSSKSPALQMTIRHAVAVLSSMPSVDRESFLKHPTDSTSILGPETTYHSFNTDYLVTTDAMREIASKRVAFYSYGLIEYVDIFGTSHWLTFCFLTNDITITNLFTCQRGNDTDKN